MATNVNNPPPTITTEPLAQYQQAGEGQTTHITDAAQLTHPISRADDVDMTLAPATPRPDTHDTVTVTATRRSIGGRCRKWLVSTQTPSQSNKRKCAACTRCTQQFAPSEPKLQQWANRDAQRAHVHAQCIPGGLKPDHEMVPETPTSSL